VATSAIAFDLNEGGRRSATVWDYNALYTITGWYLKTGGGDAALSILRDGNNYDWIGIFGGAIYGYQDGGAGSFQQTSSLGTGADDTWYFFGIRRTSTTNLDFFVGNEDTAAALAGTLTDSVAARPAATVFDIGQSLHFSGSNSSGRAAFVRVWTDSLSDSEIEAERTATTAQRTANLWASWPLQGASDLADASGNSRDLSAIGTLATGVGPAIGATTDEPLLAQVDGTAERLRLSRIPLELYQWINMPLSANADAGSVAATLVIDDTWPLAMRPGIADVAWIVAPLDDGAVPTAQADDSALGVDDLAGLLAATLADSGTTADALAASAVIALADLSVAIDALVSAAATTQSDTGSALDLTSGAGAASLAESVLSIDATSGSSTATVADSGVAADLLAAQTGALVSELATGVDAASGAGTTGVAESGAGADAVAGVAGARAVDTASGSDLVAGALANTLVDAAAGADVVMGALAVTVTDQAVGLDTVSTSGDDSRTAGDAGSGVDAASGSSAAGLSDLAAAADAASGIALASTLDAATAADAVLILAGAALADSAVALDAVAAVFRVTLSDFGRADDTVAALAPLPPNPPGRATLRPYSPIATLRPTSPQGWLVAPFVARGCLTNSRPCASLAARLPRGTLIPRV
jgi:hypothetical protein